MSVEFVSIALIDMLSLAVVILLVVRHYERTHSPQTTISDALAHLGARLEELNTLHERTREEFDLEFKKLYRLFRKKKTKLPAASTA